MVLKRVHGSSYEGDRVLLTLGAFFILSLKLIL